MFYLSLHLCVQLGAENEICDAYIDIPTIPSSDMMFKYHLKAINASYLWCPFIQEVQLFLQILGIVENMSCFKCPHCGEPSYIFGKEGTRKTATEMGLDFLGEVCQLLYFWNYNFAA